MWGKSLTFVLHCRTYKYMSSRGIVSKPKPIKPFKTLEEEAVFWDTHDVSPLFKHPKTTLSVLPHLETKKQSSLTVRLQDSVKKKIDSIARRKGINASTLSRIWLIEKVQEYSMQP